MLTSQGEGVGWGKKKMAEIINKYKSFIGWHRDNVKHDSLFGSKSYPFDLVICSI